MAGWQASRQRTEIVLDARIRAQHPNERVNSPR
jgi:hypothetical protein